MKNGGKNKSVAFIILFSVYLKTQQNYAIKYKVVHKSHVNTLKFVHFPKNITIFKTE